MYKKIGWLVALFATVPVAVWGEPLRVNVALRFQGLEAPGEEVTLRFQGSSEGKSSPKEFELSVPGSVNLELELGKIWHFTLEDSSLWWSPGTTIFVSPDLKVVPIDVYAASTVTGKVEVHQNEEKPEVLQVRFESSTAEGGLAEHTVPCSVESAQFSCIIPAGKLDLRLRAPRFISKYFWNLEAKPGGRQDLGLLKFERGASLSGTVETEDGSPLILSAGLELRPQAKGLPRNPRAVARDEFLVEKHPIGENGFFHVQGVKPGTYVLTVLQEGYAPAVMAPISILHNAESEIREPIVLKRPLAFEALVNPQVDGQGRPWSIRFLSEGFYPGHLDKIEQRQLSESGIFRAEELAPGRYYLEVSDAEGSRFANESIDLSDLSNSALIEFDLVRIEGELVFVGEPLPATLWFGGKNGRRRIKIESDDQGRFEGVLPQAGTWRVDVEARLSKVQRNLEDVEVPEPRNGSPVLVELLLPNTSITGTVSDQFGDPLPAESVVTALNVEKGLESMVQQRTDSQGSFEFKGLEHGIYRFVAETALKGFPASSEPTSVILSEERETIRIELVVRETHRVTGVVESSTGTIPRAMVRVRPLAGGRSLTQFWPESLTNVQGRFETAIPATSDRLELLVGAAGHELKAFTVFAPFDQEPLRLPVEKLGGTLVLKVGDREPQEADTLFPVVFQEGKAIGGLPGLLRWASANGEANHDPSRIVIPLMAPGEYQVCVLEPSEQRAMIWTLVAPNLEKCLGGYLQPHGLLEVDLSGLVPARIDDL